MVTCWVEIEAFTDKYLLRNDENGFLFGEVWSSPIVHAISMHHGQDLKVSLLKAVVLSCSSSLQPASLQLLQIACLITSSSPGLRRPNLVSFCAIWFQEVLRKTNSVFEGRQFLESESHIRRCAYRSLSDICVSHPAQQDRVELRKLKTTQHGGSWEFK